MNDNVRAICNELESIQNSSFVRIRAKLKELESQVDTAYSERNKCVALIAKMAVALGGRAGVGQHSSDDDSWDSEWRTICFIELPSVGQISFHFHDRDRGLLSALPMYDKAWDGHSTHEKFLRMARYRASPMSEKHKEPPPSLRFVGYVRGIEGQGFDAEQLLTMYDGRFFVVSRANNPKPDSIDRRTLVFDCDAYGKITNWCESLNCGDVSLVAGMAALERALLQGDIL